MKKVNDKFKHQNKNNINRIFKGQFKGQFKGLMKYIKLV